jgi:uncharacterized membrane protein YcaP (DUF421 family)
MFSGQLDLLVSVFGPDQGNLHWWQITARGVAVFLICIMLIRIMCRRAFGMQSYLDIALAVLIGSILSRAVTGTAPFIGTTLATTAMAACYWALAHLAQRFHVVGWLVKGSARVLVRDGEPDEQAMRRVGISHTDLKEAVRQADLLHVDQVRLAVLERSGRISVLRRE